jgi:predicted ferric reductase
LREKKQSGGIVPFIAGGVGITPVLGQLSSIDVPQLRLPWSTGLGGIGLVVGTFEKYPQLVQSTTLFVTSKEAYLDERELNILNTVIRSRVKTARSRLEKSDVDEVNGQPRIDEWYICVGPDLKEVGSQLASRKKSPV